MFRDKLEAWLSRSVPERALNQCFDVPVVLTTDIGLQRSENQDRVAALRINAKAPSGRPLIAIAVADGMGGMRDGAKCATLALSNFFYGLTLYRGHGIERRTAEAIAYANDAVFRFADGKGGATLSVIVLDDELRPLIAHLGDTRIYSFGGGTKVQRLTTDDSLAEAVGGHGRDLLQFVGMGEGMQPHITPISIDIKQLAITTDGIHFIEANTLESVLSHSGGLRAASERLAALARWCGGPDNASSALVDLQPLMGTIRNGAENAIELWDPFGHLTTMWIKTDDPSAAERQVDGVVVARSPDLKPAEPPHGPERSKRKSPPRKAREHKADRPPKQDIQLDIQIEQSADPEESNDDSR